MQNPSTAETSDVLQRGSDDIALENVNPTKASSHALPEAEAAMRTEEEIEEVNDEVRELMSSDEPGWLQETLKTTNEVREEVPSDESVSTQHTIKAINEGMEEVSSDAAVHEAKAATRAPDEVGVGEEMTTDEALPSNESFETCEEIGGKEEVIEQPDEKKAMLVYKDNDRREETCDESADGVINSKAVLNDDKETQEGEHILPADNTTESTLMDKTSDKDEKEAPDKEGVSAKRIELATRDAMINEEKDVSNAGRYEHKRVSPVRAPINKLTGINAMDSNNYTPLHYAVRAGSITAVKTLIRLGALAKVKGGISKKVTPLDIAQEKGFDDIHKLLKEHAVSKEEEEEGEEDNGGGLIPINKNESHPSEEPEENRRGDISLASDAKQGQSQLKEHGEEASGITTVEPVSNTTQLEKQFPSVEELASLSMSVSSVEDKDNMGNWGEHYDIGKHDTMGEDELYSLRAQSSEEGMDANQVREVKKEHAETTDTERLTTVSSDEQDLQLERRHGAISDQSIIETGKSLEGESIFEDNSVTSKKVEDAFNTTNEGFIDNEEARAAYIGDFPSFCPLSSASFSTKCSETTDISLTNNIPENSGNTMMQNTLRTEDNIVVHVPATNPIFTEEKTPRARNTLDIPFDDKPQSSHIDTPSGEYFVFNSANLTASNMHESMQMGSIEETSETRERWIENDETVRGEGRNGTIYANYQNTIPRGDGMAPVSSALHANFPRGVVNVNQVAFPPIVDKYLPMDQPTQETLSEDEAQETLSEDEDAVYAKTLSPLFTKLLAEKSVVEKLEVERKKDNFRGRSRDRNFPTNDFESLPISMGDRSADGETADATTSTESWSTAIKAFLRRQSTEFWENNTCVRIVRNAHNKTTSAWQKVGFNTIEFSLEVADTCFCLDTVTEFDEYRKKKNGNDDISGFYGANSEYVSTVISAVSSDTGSGAASFAHTEEAEQVKNELRLTQEAVAAADEKDQMIAMKSQQQADTLGKTHTLHKVYISTRDKAVSRIEGRSYELLEFKLRTTLGIKPTIDSAT